MRRNYTEREHMQVRTFNILGVSKHQRTNGMTIISGHMIPRGMWNPSYPPLLPSFQGVADSRQEQFLPDRFSHVIHGTQF